MNVSIESLKALRELSGAGMMDCRKALLQAQGDQEAAVKLINEWGLATAKKREDRETKEGRVAIALGEGIAALGKGAAAPGKSAVALAALACETDFVALNTSYMEAVDAIASEVLRNKLATPNETIAALIADVNLRMKEHIVLKGIAYIEAKGGEFLDSYLHGQGSIGVALRASAQDPSYLANSEVRRFIHDLSLQVAAKAPLFVKKEDFPPSVVEAKRKELTEALEEDPAMKAKSPAMKDSIITGRLRKYLSSVCLYEQPFIKDESVTIGKALENFAAATGAHLQVGGFVRLAIADAGN